MKEKLKLFNQIINVHYSTDFSSIDRIYPPFFVWDNNEKNKIEKFFRKMRKTCGEYDLYIHFPYCQEKCAFCRHCSSVPSNENKLVEYLIYLEKEITKYGDFFSRPRLGHIYFGGGTPTLLDLEKVMLMLREKFTILPNHQLNIESTFSYLDLDKIKKLKSLGITRLVLGAQSFDQSVLSQINRTQTKEYFKQVYDWAREVGIETINVELMGGLPGQTYESFISDLEYLINLKVDSIHIYSYMQTVKTPLGKSGENKVDNDLKIKMIEDGEKILEKSGYHYYGDDYSRQREGRNLSISRVNRLGVGKLALGLSAAGYIPSPKWQTLSYINTTDLVKYLELLDKNLFPVEKFYFLDKDESLRSLLISNLRMLDRKVLDKKIVNYLYRRFKKELGLIKKECEVIDDEDQFLVKDWLVNSKYLYSKKVLKKCVKIIARDFPEVSEEIIF